MQIFTTLEDARVSGACLGRYGQYPAIYRRGTKEYILVEEREWPLSDSWPFMKWDGKDWLPVLIRLDTLQHAQEATHLFTLLGHSPIIVEFPGITFDIFLREAHIPPGAWIVCKVTSNYFIKYMKPSEDEEPDIIEVEMSQL